MKHLLIFITAILSLNLTAQMAITVPAEYENNDGLIMTWPYQADFDSIIAEISGLAAASGDVWLIYNPDSISTDTNDIRIFLQTTGNNHDNIYFTPAHCNTFFIREYGPVTGYGVFDQLLVRYMGDPVFDNYNRPQDDSLPAQLANSWQWDYVQYTLAFEPGNILTDGKKNVFASANILEENLPLTQSEVAQQLSSLYDVTSITFLDAPEHSGGGSMKSLDMFARLLDSETILMTKIPDSLPDYPLIEANVATIQNMTNSYESPYKIVRVQAAPLDKGRYDTTLDGELRSYTNSLILNNLILVPSYNNPAYDSAAFNAYKDNTYGMSIHMIDARKLSALHAALHTITKEIPQEHYLRISHKKVEGPQEYQGSEFTITCLATGDDIIDNIWLYYRFNDDTTWQKSMVHLVCPTFYGTIENVQLTDTIHYYIEAAMVNGTTITYPLSAPEGNFSFWFDVTGINALKEAQPGIILYPNPVKEILHIKHLESDKPVSYQITDITGKVIQQGTVDGGRSVAISSKITSGSYLLLLKTAGSRQSIPFIKQP